MSVKLDSSPIQYDNTTTPQLFHPQKNQLGKKSAYHLDGGEILILRQENKSMWIVNREVEQKVWMEIGKLERVS
jgi:hypothetical protein